VTKEELEVLNLIKFEFAKMGIEIFDEVNFDFKYQTKFGPGQVHTENVIRRYFALTKESQRKELLSCVIKQLMGNDGGQGGAVPDLV